MILVCNSVINQKEWDDHMQRISNANKGGETHIGKTTCGSSPNFPGLLISLIDSTTLSGEGMVFPLFVSHKQLQRAMGFNNLEELHSVFDVKPIETTPEVSESREV